ncbi:MAG: FtsQ-type POTRA domain-containing protein [Clostridia bacterium]|nr:FtsQ-type POTRA domain-containing protein [Clostridia bacterium]
MAKRVVDEAALERRKKRRKRRLIAGFVVFLITALSVAAVLSVTVLFPVKTVKATGSKLYTEEQIVKSSGISEENNLFTLSAQAVTENLVRNLPYIDSVELKREIPDKITIVVKDASEYACFFADDVYYVISKGGRVINAYTEQPENTFLIVGCTAKCKVGQMIEFDGEDNKELVFSIAENLDNKNVFINKINVSDEYNITLTVEGRFNVILGSKINADKKIAQLSSMIESMEKDATGRIDLSIWTEDNRTGSFVAGDIE